MNGKLSESGAKRCESFVYRFKCQSVDCARANRPPPSSAKALCCNIDSVRCLQKTTKIVLPPWITEVSLVQPIGPQILRASFGPGESEAISLALEVGALWVILDDRPTRRLAEALNIPVIGTLGVLLASKRRGFLSTVRPCIDALMNHEFRIAPDLYERVLSDAGED